VRGFDPRDLRPSWAPRWEPSPGMAVALLVILFIVMGVLGWPGLRP
jgi:hypothetical protein